MLTGVETNRSNFQNKQAEEPRLYFDVREFKEEDLTLILAENRLAELEKRISPYPLIYDAEGQALMINERGDLEALPLDESEELGRLEIEGMTKIKQLIDYGYKAVAWFSPAGGKSEYVENRIVVAKAVEGFENAKWLSTYWGTDEKLKEKIVRNLQGLKEQGGLVLESRGICSEHQREVFVEKVEEIMADEERENGTLGRILEAEDLRNNPIGLDLREGESWYGYLSKYFEDVSDIWEAISEGEDLRNKLELAKVAAEVKGVFGVRMAGITTFTEAVKLGAEIERYIAEHHGINLKAGGAHGRSNSSLETGGKKLSAFAKTFKENKTVTKDTPGAKKCIKCGVYYVGNECPLCS